MLNIIKFYFLLKSTLSESAYVNLFNSHLQFLHKASLLEAFFGCKTRKEVVKIAFIYFFYKVFMIWSLGGSYLHAKSSLKFN